MCAERKTWLSSGENQAVVWIVQNILDSKGDGDVVRVKAMVLQKSDTELVYSRSMKRNLQKADVTVVILLAR